MESITLLHPYYDHRAMLNYQLAEWNSWSNDNKKYTQIILIDDCSKVHPFDPKKHNINCNLDVYKIADDILWNVSGARNLGFKLAETSWVIAMDMDLILENKELNKIRKLDFSDKYKIYFPNRKRITGKHEVERKEPPHCNSYIINKEIFWEVGGYDEDFAGGWGSEDSFFMDRLAINGIKKVILDDVFFSSRHSSKGRTPTVKDRVGANRNKQLIYKKLVTNRHSGDPIRFRWEKIYSHRIN